MAVIKCGGAILREHDGSVALPFGSEYSILLKNLDDRKACVKVSIDGRDVVDGSELVVNPNTTTELEGFMQGSAVRNKFKFIKKTAEIVQHRGDRIDDGIVRVEFRFGKRIVEDVVHHTHVYHDVHYPSRLYYPYPYYPWHPWYPTIIYRAECSGGDIVSTENFTASNEPTIGSTLNMSSLTKASAESVNCNFSAPVNINPDEGITVHGSETHQAFTPVYVGEMEEGSTVITIRLVGSDASGLAVDRPITTHTKYECPTCGKHCESDTQYCGRCGTYLLTSTVKRA